MRRSPLGIRTGRRLTKQSSPPCSILHFPRPSPHCCTVVRVVVRDVCQKTPKFSAVRMLLPPPRSPVIGLLCHGALGEVIRYYVCSTVSSLTHTQAMISVVRVHHLDPSRRSHRLGRDAISGTSSCPSAGGLFNQRGVCHSLVSRGHARGPAYLKYIASQCTEHRRRIVSAADTAP